MKEEKSNWFKEHADAAIVVLTLMTTIVGSVVWMTSQIHCLDMKHTAQFYELKQEIAQVQSEIAIIKTVLIMKEIMPHEICAMEQLEDN